MFEAHISDADPLNFGKQRKRKKGTPSADDITGTIDNSRKKLRRGTRAIGDANEALMFWCQTVGQDDSNTNT
jgi:hypothetical protein